MRHSQLKPKPTSTIASDAMVALEAATSQPNFLAALRAIHDLAQEAAKSAGTVKTVDALTAQADNLVASGGTLKGQAAAFSNTAEGHAKAVDHVAAFMSHTPDMTREQTFGKNITTETFWSEHYKLHEAEINAPSVPFVPYVAKTSDGDGK